MVTPTELRAVPLFSKLADTDLEYLSRNAADIHVRPGEYVVHEGENRAFFVVIEGKLDATKIVEGVERVVGVRAPGDLFGEVPTMLNTPFLASLRAKEPSRVIRIDPKVFHTIAAAAPEISATVGAAALDRISGLQDIAAQPPPPEVTVVGAQWDPASHEIREFLHRNQVPFEWFTPEDPRAASFRSDSARYPIVQLKDGTRTVAPSMRDLAKSVGLSVAPLHAEYDVVIVGGGPAGIAAAVYGASEGLRTVLIERNAPGGQAGQSSRIENYLGFPFGVSGDELANRALHQAKRFDAEIVVTRNVESLSANERSVTLDGSDILRARAVILALGVNYRRLPIDSCERLAGRGIYYGAARSEASATAGQDIFLVGAGNSAGQAALFFSEYARSVTLLCRSDSLAKSMSYYLIEQLKTKSNIRVELLSEIVGAHGDEHLEAIDVRDHSSETTTRRPTTSVFIFIGAYAQTDWLPPDVARDQRGFILTGADLLKAGRWKAERDPYLVETSAPGVFAVGDIRAGSVKRVASGVGEGSIAIAFVHRLLEHEQATRAAAAPA